MKEIRNQLYRIKKQFGGRTLADYDLEKHGIETDIGG